MSFFTKTTKKPASKNSSAGESIAENKGISAPAVPAFQMKQAIQKMSEEEEPLQGKFETQLMAEEEEQPLQGKFETAQLQEEEEPLQGKFETAQLQEEEEPLQGKFETAQLQEEEEPLQGKFETAQLQEEEESLQGKFETAQLQEEEEPLQGKFETAQLQEEEEPLQGKFETAQLQEEEEPLQGKFETAQLQEEEEPLQGKFLKPFQLKTNSSGSVAQLEAEKSPNQTGMPGSLKAGIENLSGYSMDDVKVHYNSDKPKQLKALAYAQGTDIHIAPGQEKHLPHEAWHVAQQKQGRVQPTVQMKKGTPVNDDAGLEHEADVMGAKAADVGREITTPVQSLSNTAIPATAQRVAQLKNPPPIGVRSLNPGSGATIDEAPSKKSEEEEGFDSFIDTYSGAQGAATDFLTSGPVSYTNSNNKKIDDDGNTVVDEDKAVAKGHTSDPLGKAASAAGVGAGMYTGIFGMYQAVQKFREGEINSQIEGVFSMLTSTSTMVKSGADMAKTTAKEGSDTAKEAGKTSSIAGTVTDGIDAVKSLVLTIKGIYDAYQDAQSTEGSSSREKLETGMATVRGLVESAGKAVSMGKSIADMLQTGSAGLASAVPGLSIALSAIDTAIAIYNLIKAKTNESFVKEQLKKNMWEVGASTFGKGKEGRKQRDLYVKTFEDEIASMTAKRADLVTQKAALAASGGDQTEVDAKIKSLDDSLALANKQLDGVKENNALTQLKNVNQGRKYNAGFEIAVNMVKIVGDVLSLVPEPGSQVASMSLKLIAGGSKVAKGLGSKIIQWGRDKAAGKSDSALNKIFDSTKSSAAVKERNVGTIKYIFSQVSALPAPADPQFAAKTTIIEQLISATGCAPKALYREVTGNGIQKGVHLLFKSLGQ